MSDCKLQVDPIDFGEVREKAISAHQRVDGLNEKLEKIDDKIGDVHEKINQKIDKMKWIVVAGLLTSPILNDIVPSGSDVLLVLVETLAKVTNASTW